MYWTLHEPNALLGGVTGRHLPRGAIWRWWWRRKQARRDVGVSTDTDASDTKASAE